ncbi:MAG: type II toxin-antitoxin system HicA family toxin [bacterium]
MSRLNNVSGRQVMRVAEKRGWVWKRNTGDHYVYVHRNFAVNLSIPDHRELSEGTIRSAIRKM